MDRKLLKRIETLAIDEDWKLREDAAAMIKKINDNHFDEYMPIWKQWIANENPNIRRVALVGLVRINKEHANKAIELIEPLLRDKNNYVRRNCGPFVLSRICYKVPGFAFNKLNEWLKDNDENIRWNVASCLGGWFGMNYPDEALKMLRILALDERRYVWRAVASSVIKILRKYPEKAEEIKHWNCNNRVLETISKYIK